MAKPDDKHPSATPDFEMAFSSDEKHPMYVWTGADEKALLATEAELLNLSSNTPLPSEAPNKSKLETDKALSSEANEPPGIAALALSILEIYLAIMVTIIMHLAGLMFLAALHFCRFGTWEKGPDGKMTIDASSKAKLLALNVISGSFIVSLMILSTGMFILIKYVESSKRVDFAMDYVGGVFAAVAIYNLAVSAAQYVIYGAYECKLQIVNDGLCVFIAIMGCIRLHKRFFRDPKPTGSATDGAAETAV
ncbi:hypothetical protein L228DRAFT_273897 [Xylona heveae TC161]|uniref:Uncharacterized protein n=1 Tax=Xylona heveae (strain CBS 132557 / TC161) TaxID=1328760 RepID=A0A164ZTF9_XYLHT|nr:hypothetical protein L228DRAFT_273897 [Xylona heveae TC161]KZF19490.1 hypothetical protein L228DRAFT_273897 [Xylona heveae TC161]